MHHCEKICRFDNAESFYLIEWLIMWEFSELQKKTGFDGSFGPGFMIWMKGHPFTVFGDVDSIRTFGKRELDIFGLLCFKLGAAMMW
jgi:hypothetical protein